MTLILTGGFSSADVSSKILIFSLLLLSFSTVSAIASSIIELVCEDLKFRDMQNDAKYLMLNSRLKENKKQDNIEVSENPKGDK